MKPTSPPEATDAAAAASDLTKLHAAVVFLARFFGVTAESERLRASLAAYGNAQSATSASALPQILAHGGLVGSELSASSARRPTEMPALLLNSQGEAVVVLAIKQDRYECHLPGIEGSSWLDAAALASEVPSARWIAVRQKMFF